MRRLADSFSTLICLVTALGTLLLGTPTPAQAISPDGNSTSTYAKRSQGQSNQKKSTNVGKRLLYETIGGILGGAVGALIGYGSGLKYAQNHPHQDEDSWVIFSAAAVGLAGTSIGTFAGGDTANGSGGAFPTVLGGLVGAIGGITAVAVADDPTVAGAVVGIPALTLAGSMLGYEISHGARVSAGSASLRAAPTVAVGPKGRPNVGLSLSF